MSGKLVRFAVLGALMLGTLGCTAVISDAGHGPRYRPVPRATPVEISIFYDELGPYGHWFVHGSYGWVWTPYDLPYGWRPYTDGRWVYTEYGWTWASDEPWGWAPFHYGRWLFDSEYGWVWVPGTVWAPAWVCWRWSDDWIGWAPLPPGVDWEVGVGLRFGDRDLQRDLDVPRWCFMRRRWLIEPNVRVKLEPSPRNVSLMAATRIFSDYDDIDGRPRNKGIDVREVERSLPRPVPRVKAIDAGSPGKAKYLARGKEIQVYRPEIRPSAGTSPSVTPKVQAREIPDPAIQARKEKVQRQFESSFEKQQRRIESAQLKELRDAPPETDPETLRRRHEAERRALEEQKQRELEVSNQRLEKQIIKPDRKAKQRKVPGSK